MDKETINRLIVSLKSKRKARLMDPIEIATTLKFLCDHMPREEVARRFNIDERSTLWVYLRLLSLPKKVQQLIRDGKIGMDTGYRISILDRYGSMEEQEILADATIKYKLSSNEVRGIVQSLKKRNPDLGIEECIRLALKARPLIEEEHLVITRIKDDTLLILRKKSHLCQMSLEEMVKKCIEKHLPPQSITSLKLSDTKVIISLTKERLKVFKEKARNLKIKPEHLVEFLVQRCLLNED